MLYAKAMLLRAVLLLRGGQIQEAEAVLHAARQTLDRTVGPSNLCVASALVTQANVHAVCGRPAEAIALYEKASAMVISAVGMPSFLRHVVDFNMGVVYALKGEGAKAVDAMERILSMESSVNASHPWHHAAEDLSMWIRSEYNLPQLAPDSPKKKGRFSSATKRSRPATRDLRRLKMALSTKSQASDKKKTPLVVLAEEVPVDNLLGSSPAKKEAPQETPQEKTTMLDAPSEALASNLLELAPFLIFRVAP